MDAKNESGPAAGLTQMERLSERELIVRRSFDAPARLVFEAWTRPELFMRWWALKSIGIPLLSCQMDVRTGGKYRLEFGQDAANTWVFFGKYLEVIPQKRLVWTNDEGEEGAITTVTFEEKDGRTLLVVHDLYPSKDALEEALANGSPNGFSEQFEQLDAILGELG